MINILDFALFRVINDYARLPIFDLIFPFLSTIWVFPSFVLILLVLFAVFCKKVYGEFFWRLMALSLLFTLTICISDFGSKFLKNHYERLRPIETLPHIVYFDTNLKAWYNTEETIVSTPDENAEKSPSIVKKPLKNSDGSEETLEGSNSKTNPLNASESPEKTLETKDDANLLADNLDQTIDDKIMEEVDSDNHKSDIETGQTIENISVLKYNFKTYDKQELAEILNNTGFSIPSSMASNFMAVVLIISLLLPRTTPWIYLIPIVMGWIKVYCGYSFPLDIIMGWIWGIVSVAIAWLICEFIFRKFSKTKKLNYLND